MKVICPHCNNEFMTNDNSKRLLDFLREEGDKYNLDQIRKKLKLSRPSIYYHVNKLVKMNLIETFKDRGMKGQPVYCILRDKMLVPNIAADSLRKAGLR